MACFDRRGEERVGVLGSGKFLRKQDKFLICVKKEHVDCDGDLFPPCRSVVSREGGEKNIQNMKNNIFYSDISFLFDCIFEKFFIILHIMKHIFLVMEIFV